MTDWSVHSHEVSTAALLGTERRTVPSPSSLLGASAGVVAVREVVLDAETHRPTPRLGEADPARRAVRLVAAGAIAHRAGTRPLPAVEPCRQPLVDTRPPAPTVVVALWARIGSHWPALDEEFVARILGAGVRLPADLVPPMLLRWRGAPTAHARVRAAAGPLAEWLITLSPGLASRGRPAKDVDLLTLPTAPVTPALASAIEAADGDAPDRDPPDAGPLSRLVFGASYSDRIVVANAIRTLSTDGLVALLRVLEPTRGDPPTAGLAPAVRDLAGLRLALHRALPRAGLGQRDPFDPTSPSTAESDQEGPAR